VKKLFFFCVVVIAYFTLYPWRFVPFHEHSTILQIWRPFIGRGDYLDIVVNLCFYLPLGVLGVLGYWKGSGTPTRWIALASLGASLSLSLETIQAWVPGRESSLLDVLANTISTVAGAWLGLTAARQMPSGLHQGVPLPRPMPAILIAAWLVSQWFPFLPVLRVSQFSESLHAFVDVSSLRWLDPAEAFVTALLISRLLRDALTSPAYRFAFAAACLVLPARIFIVVGATPWPLTVAFVTGLLVSQFVLSRAHSETRLLAAAALLLIGVRQLDPFQFVVAAEPFHWIPFSGFLEATRGAAIRVAAEKFFLYGAAVWMVRESGASLRTAAGVVAGLLAAGEYAQRYLPGRVAESTDPVLAVIAACVMVWMKDRSRAPAASAAGLARESRRHKDHHA
jgi:VanZ family protein